MRPDDEDFDGHQKVEHFNNYADYSRTLRAWLVAYGIGGPVLVVTNKELLLKVAASDSADIIIFAFLLGVVLQILLAFINKWAAWYMYSGAGDKEYQEGRTYRFWFFINRQTWLDFSIDIVSVFSFMYATWRVLSILLGPNNSILPN